MRKTLDIADYMHDWYTAKAKKLNIPASALMIMALNEYMKNENAVLTISDAMQHVKIIDSKQGK